MKKLTVFFVSLFLLSLCGCTLPVISPDTTGPVAAQVTDCYSHVMEGCCYHIPQITLEGISTDAVNQIIYGELYGLLQADVYDCLEYGCSIWCYGMTYTWVQKGTVVSIVAQADAPNDVSVYFVYNISAENGQLLTDAQLFAALQLTPEDAIGQIRGSLEKYWEQFGDENADAADWVADLREKTLSDENVADAFPCLLSDGQLGFVGNIYSFAGADSYRYIMDMDGNTTRLTCPVHNP